MNIAYYERLLSMGTNLADLSAYYKMQKLPTGRVCISSYPAAEDAETFVDSALGYAQSGNQRSLQLPKEFRAESEKGNEKPTAD